VTEELKLHITDDQGVDYEVGKPKLTNMNRTEWWALQEIMEHQKCKIKTSGFNELFVDYVTTPGGDRYIINEYYEVITSVRKLKEKETFED
jgi:hypothetical protein